MEIDVKMMHMLKSSGIVVLNYTIFTLSVGKSKFEQHHDIIMQ